ncbi:MAG: protein kinase domain-containing protein [Planctomycetaceae bacterium]
MAEEAEGTAEAYRLAGDRLGKFVVLQELGRGAMGVVYESFQEDLKRKVAIKILPANISLDSKQVQRFHREAESAARLRHDNIIAIYEVGQFENTHYFAMELVEGRSFAGLAARDLEEVREAARMARDAARGLAHAHARGVIHRDIKPGNILVSRDGRVVVTDFGLARLTESASLTSTDAIVGTPKYMSPEQILPGARPLDGRMDVYSLGATLYEILAGRPPIQAPTVQAFIKAVLEEYPPSPRRFNKAIPHDLATILLRCLEKDAADRYPTMEALAEDLERFVQGERIVARPKRLLARAVEQVRRHRIVTALAVVSVVALIALLVVARVAVDRNLQRRLTEASQEQDPHRAVERAEQLLREFPRRDDVRSLRASALGRRAHTRLKAFDLEGAIEDLVAAGDPDPFWHAMLLVELGRGEEARSLAEARPAGDSVRILTLARLSVEAREYDEAVAALSGMPEETHALAHLTLAQAYQGLAQAATTISPAASREYLDSARRALTRAAEQSQESREDWIRARIQVRLADVKSALGETVNVGDVLSSFGGAAREAMRSLTGFWGGMSRLQAGNVEKFVRAVLTVAGQPVGTLPVTLKKEAERRLREGATGPEAVKANLLLAVAVMSGGGVVGAGAQDALDAALLEAEGPMVPYVFWGMALLRRAQDGLDDALSFAVNAVENAESMPGFPDLEALVQTAVLLGEEAVERGRLDAARRAASYLSLLVDRRPDLAGLCAAFLERVRAS